MTPAGERESYLAASRAFLARSLKNVDVGVPMFCLKAAIPAASKVGE